jgi:hypothetical protein
MGKEIEKLCTVPLCIAARNIKWYSHCGKYESRALKLKIELTHDLAILIRDIQPRVLKNET